MGLVALQYVGSSHIKAGTHVSCIGRQILDQLSHSYLVVFFTTESPIYFRSCEFLIINLSSGVLQILSLFERPLSLQSFKLVICFLVLLCFDH